MRALGRLALVPIQCAASVLVALALVIARAVATPWGYILRGDADAFLSRDPRPWHNRPVGVPEYTLRWQLSKTLAWVWRPRFVAPKGPRQF